MITMPFSGYGFHNACGRCCRCCCCCHCHCCRCCPNGYARWTPNTNVHADWERRLEEIEERLNALDDPGSYYTIQEDEVKGPIIG